VVQCLGEGGDREQRPYGEVLWFELGISDGW